MKTKLKLSVACGIAALLVGFNVQAQEKTFNIGGDVELDLTAKGGDADTSYYNGGRIKLNATGELKGDDYFIKGVAQPLVPFKGSDLGYDDVYLQMGRSGWDVQIGRFEGVDLFPVGKDTVAEHAGSMSPYGTNAARGRKDSVIHTAVHLKPNDAMNFELGVMAAKNTSDFDKFAAVRPAVTYKAGAVTVRAGLESVKSTVDDVETSHTGFGVGAGFDVAGGTANASLSKKNADNDGTDVTSVALNFTQGPWGVGYVTSKEDYTGADAKLNTFYGAYTVPLFGAKDATVTFAASTSKATDVGGVDGTDDKVNAARVRFNYTF
ncbi:carbohydrate porin [uncultured Thiothrix sp.]|uniref:carbohydrate porin n=1 Tax=uncultured Thiothrix sp. TaxID=223185 RepID=UPI0026144748|nr:carbohydrate porin [uncultured Thiothrix sp.]HMT92777.1 carbohydrate porin [Thiolinea sp.]